MLAVWTSGRIRAKSYGFDYFTLKATIKKGKRNYHFYLVVYSENRNFLFRCARWSKMMKPNNFSPQSPQSTPQLITTIIGVFSRVVRSEQGYCGDCGE